MTEGWKTLKRAIPDGAAKAVANRLNVSADHVRRWRREPLSIDAPVASGQRSPLDRVCDLIDATFLSNPIGAALIAEHVWTYYQKLRDAVTQQGDWDRRAHAATMLREAVEAVNCLNLDRPDEETIKEIVEAREALDQALAHLRNQHPAKKRRGPSSLFRGIDRLHDGEERAS